MDRGMKEDQDKSQVWITKLISFLFLTLNWQETCFRSQGRCSNNPRQQAQKQHHTLLFHCFLKQQPNPGVRWRVQMLQAALWWNVSLLHLILMSYLHHQNSARTISGEWVAQKTAILIQFPDLQQTSCTCEWKKEAKSAIYCGLQQLACKGKEKTAIGHHWDRWSSLDQTEESPRPSPV